MSTSAGDRMVLVSPVEAASPSPALRHRWDVVTVVDPEPVWGHVRDVKYAVPTVLTIGSLRFRTRGSVAHGAGRKALVGRYDPGSRSLVAVPVALSRLHPLSLLSRVGQRRADAFAARPEISYEPGGPTGDLFFAEAL